MAEYIEREAAIKRFREIKESGVSLRDSLYLDAVMAVLENINASDVAPVVNGRWVQIYSDGEPAIDQHQIGVCCSKCMKMPKDKFTESRYCPSCGAKMDGAKTE